MIVLAPWRPFTSPWASLQAPIWPILSEIARAESPQPAPKSPHAAHRRVTRERHCLDARHHLAACLALFLLGRPLGRADIAGRRDRHRTVDRGHQRNAEPME